MKYNEVFVSFLTLKEPKNRRGSVFRPPPLYLKGLNHKGAEEGEEVEFAPFRRGS